jgi:glutamate racemase
VEHLFRRHLPAATRILSQPEIVADSLEDYLDRHPHYVDGNTGTLELLTTAADAVVISKRARVFWPDAPAFQRATQMSFSSS